MNNPEHRESLVGLNSGKERNSMSFEDNNYDEPKKKRNCCVRFCCCCCLSRKGALACAVITLVLLGGIGCAIFFLFPRIPEFEFKDVTFADGTSFNGASIQNQLKASDGAYSIPLSINVNIKSENYIDINVSNVTVDGTLNGAPIGYGALKQPISIKGHDTTVFKFPFTITYNLKDTSSGNRNALKTLAESCSSDPSKRKKIKINYNAKLYIDLIKWTGYVPSLDNSFDFDCQWDIADLFGGGIDVSSIQDIIGRLKV